MPTEAVHHRQTQTSAGQTQPVLTTLFDRVAARFTDRIALVEGDRRTTYAELDAMSDRVAGRLREHQVELGEPVGVHLARRTELYAVMLGVLKAGACVVPLNPEPCSGLVCGDPTIRDNWHARSVQCLYSIVTNVI